MQRVMIRIRGNVQGVFFRAGVKEIADELGLTGLVKNDSNGSVIVIAEGGEEGLQKLIEWCRKGNELSRVEGVKVEWGNATGEFKEFALR